MAAEQRRFWIIAIGLSALTIAVYGRVGSFEFSEFDDTTYVVNCPLVQNGLSWPGVREAFTTFRAGNWHPLTWLSLMADRQLFGPGPRAFHLTNLALHFANTLLLLVALWHMTGELARSALVAVLFALHPLHVESVAWVSERKDVLSAFFWMLALVAYSRYSRKPGLGRYLPVLVAFALGLLAKPMVVTLPCVLLLLDVWPLQRLRMTPDSHDAPSTAESLSPSRSHRSAMRSNLKPQASGLKPGSRAAATGIPKTSLSQLLLEKMPLFALVGASCLATLYAQRYAMASLSGGSFSVRLANAATAYTTYIFQTLWPVDLACFYPYRPVGWTSPLMIASMLVLVAVTIGTFAARRFPWLIVGWFWFLGTLVPVIGLVQVGGQSRADRYTYIPLIGLFLMAAWSIPARWWSVRRNTLFVATATILGALSVLSWTQVGYWRNDQTLFEHALAVTEDNDVAHLNLGFVRQKQGKVAEAERHYREAIRITPKGAMAHSLLSQLVLRRGDVVAALEHAREAVDSHPNIPESQATLGMALVANKNIDEAVEHFYRAVQLMPDQPDYHHFLGLALSDTGQLEPAAAAFRAAIRLRPFHAHAHNELGAVLARQGHRQQAIEEFQTALRINPALTSAQENLRQIRAQPE